MKYLHEAHGLNQERMKFIKRLESSKVGRELESLNVISDKMMDDELDWNDIVYYLGFLLENETDYRGHGSRYMDLTESQYRYLIKMVNEANTL